MALVTTRCPNCGGEIQLNDKRETGFCLYCGCQIDVKEALNPQNANMTGTETDVENWKAAFDTYYLLGNYDKAEIMADNIIQARPNHPESLNRLLMARSARILVVSNDGYVTGLTKDAYNKEKMGFDSARSNRHNSKLIY